MSAFEFVEELPDSRGGNTREQSRLLSEFAAALEGSPGQWAKYPLPLSNDHSAHQSGHRIRTGQSKAFRGGTFEATVREGQLYVRAVIA